MQQSLRKETRHVQGWTKVLLLLLGFMASTGAWAQIAVSGKVTGEDNSPIPGVNILIKGTNAGTIADVDGNFKITATSTSDVLVFSFVGYLTQEVVVGNQTTFEVKLQNDSKQLNEVVVTALGIRRDVKTVGFATQEVKGDDINKAREPNTINSLTGKVAGLTIGSSPELLGRPNIVLRGNTDLLFVVNGVPVNSDTWNIPADDIDTYTVLKGPTAAALYGMRGINGAIVITTKNGKRSGTDGKNWSVDFNSTTMVDKGFLAFPKNNEEYGRGSGFAYSYGDGLYDFGPTSTVGNQRLPEWGPRFEGQLVKQYDSPYDPVTKTRTATPYTARGKNNLKNFLQPGLLSTNNIAFGSSGENHSVRVSYTHTAQRGLAPNTTLNLENFNINANFNLTDKLELETRANMNYQHTPNIPDVTYGPNSYVYMFGVYGSDDYDVRSLKNYYQGPQGVAGLQQYNFEYGRLNNPYFMAQQWLRGHTKTDFFGSARLKYTISPNFNISFRTQITTWNQLRTEKVPSGISLNTYLPYWSFGYSGDYRADQRQLFENNSDLLLNYTKKTNKWNINAFAGASERLFQYRSQYTTTKGLSIPEVYNFNNSLAAVQAWAFGSDMTVYSGYFSADVAYDKYVNLSVTGREDNLSTLPKGHRSFFYPSAALTTVVSDYVNLPEAISFLKLRASYSNVKGGLTSSQIGSAYQANTGNTLNSGLLGYGSELYTSYDGPNYANQNQYTSTNYYNGTPSVLYPSTIPNQAIKPFTIESYEAGFDIRFLGNRLGLDGTYFTNFNGPGITPLPVDPATGYYTKNENALTTQKKGIEIVLKGTPIQAENGFRWDILANYSTFKETLSKIGGGLESFSLNGHNYVKGERMDNYYSTGYLRDLAGDVMYNSAGAPIATSNSPSSNVLLGHMNPDFVFGINNKFSYKSFSFSFQFDGRVGGKIYDRVWYQMMNGGTALETTQGALGAARLKEWQSTAQGTKAATAAYVGVGQVLNNGTNALTIKNGVIQNPISELGLTPNTTAQTVQSYLSSSISSNFDEAYMISRTYAKLREVNITYNIPLKVFGSQTMIRRASVALVGRNLLYFAARKDFDIDQYASGYNAQSRSLTGTSGDVNLSSPTTRRYGININFGF